MESVGRYRLSRRLGAGSFATVWLGRDDDLDVDVAVKVLAENWSENDDVRSRFLAEARLMRHIRDERIVRVYDIGTLEDGRPYFVMDYADAGSLDELRKRGIEPALALRLSAEACRALQVLHANNIIHRDVTPGNLLLHQTRDNSVKVLIADLGVAKSMVGMSGATMTAGTPAYMALEQATGVGILDHRADVYSLAAVCYAMLSGRPPFPVRTLAELLARNPNEPPPMIAAQVGAPPLLDAVLAAALSPQPGRRPRSAAELGQVLDQCASQMTVALGLPSGVGLPNPAMPTTASIPLARPVAVGASPLYPPTLSSQAVPGLAPYAVASQLSPELTSHPSHPSQLSTPAEEPRSAVFYVLLAVAALAIFTVTLLIVLLLKGA